LELGGGLVHSCRTRSQKIDHRALEQQSDRGSKEEMGLLSSIETMQHPSE
jgi:hypothetical protein